MEQKKIIVTGAAGFLGGRLAKHLAQHQTEYRIVTTSRRASRAHELADTGCVFVAGDLCDRDFCATLTQGATIVIHCAALSAPFGDYDDFYRSNCVATETLLEASRRNGVGKFIFISTPSIYFNYAHRYNVKETDPLPMKMVNHYATTKAIAEKYVLDNHNQGMQTIALRPRAIIGAEDTVIFPRVLHAYRSGKLKIVGDGKNICDFTCVRNVIEAVNCCMQAPDTAYGRAYNITDGQPTSFWDAINYALTALGYASCKKRVPKGVAMLAARLSEWKAYLTAQKTEPALTRYGVGILSDNFTLDISAAKEHLHYRPIMTTYEGINEYIAWHKTKQ